MNLDQYLDVLFHVSDLAIFIFQVEEKDNDYIYKFITTNPTHQKLTGIALSEIENKTLFELQDTVPLMHLKEIKKRYDTCVRSKRIYEYEEEIWIKGKLTYWFTKLIPVLENGKVKIIIGMALDISNKKKLETQIDQQTKLLNKLLEVSPFGIAVTDANLNIIYYSPNFLKIWNLTEEQMSNNKQVFIKMLKQIKNRKKIYPKIIQSFRERKQNTIRYLILKKRIVEMIVFPIFSSANTLESYVGIYIDQTKSYLQSKKIKKILKNAILANKTKTEFLTNISHELRTPLTTILGVTEILKSQTLTESNQKYVDMIHHSSKLLLSLIDDILELSLIESNALQFKNESFSLFKMIEYLVQTYKFHCEQKDLKFIYKTNLVKDIILHADRKRIYQIINNLLSNAVKFTSKGFVEFQVIKEKETFEQVHLNFIVKDSGIGISKSELPFIFDKFKKNENIEINPTGTGIGLSLVKEFVTKMKGNIEVDTELGKGTQFSVKLTIPFIQEKEFFFPKKSENYQQYLPFLKEKKILVAEDSIDIQLLVKKFLEETQMEVIFANDGYEAIQKAKEHLLDIILLDMRMPRLDGFKAIKEIETISQAPIIAFTAYSDSEDKNTYLNLGFSDYIKKPFSKNELLEKIIKNLLRV
ncbi:MAG: response regulator [Leptonema sp. (in: bacteria)]